MKKWILVVIAAFIFGLVTAKASQEPRFEILITQRVGNYHDEIKAIHDRETGQEVVCYSMFANGPAVSCWFTGRNWK